MGMEDEVIIGPYRSLDQLKEGRKVTLPKTEETKSEEDKDEETDDADADGDQAAQEATGD